MDRFEEDVIFDVADIHVGHDPRLTKYPSGFECLKFDQDFVEKHERDLSASERYSYKENLLQVHQKRLNPPCYQIWPTFKGMKRLISDLDLPTDQFLPLYSKLIAGGDYAWAADKEYDRYQKYSVEVFGLRMEVTPLTDYNNRTKLPDPGQYGTPPKYWYESPMELIQIWRTRVFRSSSFCPSTANPLTPYRPTFPYLEKRWHPSRKQITIGFEGLDESFSRHSFRSQFFADTHQILTLRHSKSGRPLRSGSYETLRAFYCAARKVYRQLAQKSSKPLQKEVALRMGLSLTSFNRYWSRTRLRWKDALELFKSELIPPQIRNARFDP